MAPLRRARTLALIVCALLGPGPATAQTTLLIPPVDAPVTARFEAPAGPYGPGHRGLDYGAATGERVRAAAAGTITFAGPVGRGRAVSIAHAGGLATTYSILGEIFVARGESVGQGHWLGEAGAPHPGGRPGLHFGVKLAGDYVDPDRFLGPVDARRALRLVAVDSGASGCAHPEELEATPPAPNDNVAIVIGGLAGRSPRGDEDMGPRWAARSFGYRVSDVYSFSYAGTAGPRWHEPYGPADTRGPLARAARRLRRLMTEIASARPGVAVDLIAHSQGGVVARALLALGASSWDGDLPPVGHLVTLASPLRGSPLARVQEALARSVPGSAAGVVLSRLADLGVPVPDPASGAVADLRPGSDLLGELAAEDVSFGTRTLELTMAHDLVVPADRGGLDGGRIVAPEGLWGHTSVLRSRAVRALIYGFLRDAPRSCPGPWDSLGRVVGRAIGLMQASALASLR